MKIAVFTDLYLEVAGGIPSSISAQKKALEELGHEVTIFCPGFKTDDKSVVLVPTMKRLRVNGAPVAQSPRKVVDFVRNKFPVFSQFDIVHVHYEAGCSIAGVLLAHEFKVPLVQTMHGREDMAIATNVPHPFKTIAGWGLDFLHGNFLPHKRVVLRDDELANTYAKAAMWTLMVNHANSADAVITPSQHFKDKLQHYGVSKPFYVISNAISDNVLKENFKAAGMDYEKPKTREYDGKSPLKLFWSSRVSKEKRIMPFLEALRLTKTPFMMEVYGDGNDLNRAKKYVKKHNLKVRFYGRIDHTKMLERMREAQMAVVVSYGFDNQPMTILEAVSMGLPTLICDPDLVEVTGKGGLVASGPTPEEMAKALDELLVRPEKLEELSQKCLDDRERVLQSVQIEKLIKLYRSLVK